MREKQKEVTQARHPTHACNPKSPCVETGELQGLAGLCNVNSTFKERPCLKGIGEEVEENIQYPLLASAYARACTSAHMCADTHKHS